MEMLLELYVATEYYREKQEYFESNEALKLVRSNEGLADVIKITHLDELGGNKGYFDMIKDPNSELRLPFLECVYGASGIVSGYSGLEEITNQLESLNLL